MFAVNFPPPFLSFTHLTQGQIEERIFLQIGSMRFQHKIVEGGLRDY